MRKLKENLINSKKILRKIRKNIWKFLIGSQNHFKICLKSFNKIWKNYLKIVKIIKKIRDDFSKVLTKSSVNYQ